LRGLKNELSVIKKSEIDFEEKENFIVFLQLYEFYRKIKGDDKHEMNMLDFANHEIFTIFNPNLLANILKTSKENFHRFSNDFFSLIKKAENTIFYKRIENMPIFIFEIMILEKSPINNIAMYVSSWLQHEKYQKEFITKFLLKLLIENYADSNENNLNILEVLRVLTPILECGNVVKDLELKISFIDILNKQKLKVSLLEIVKYEYLIVNKKIIFKESDLNKVIQEYFYKLYKLGYSFIDQNNSNIQILDNLFKKFPDITVSECILEMIKQYKLKKDCIKILLNNKTYFKENTSNIESLIDLFIEAKNELDISNESLYLEFLADITKFIKEYEFIDKSIQYKLQTISRFYKISSVFSYNNIDFNLNEFDYKKLSLLEILEIFILKKFNIDQIINLEDFINKTDDIFENFDIEKNDYIFLLFQFFMKYKKEKLTTEIIEYFVENDYKLFEDCIDKMKKASGLSLKSYFNDHPKLKLKLLESTDRYQYLEEIIDINNNEVFGKNNKAKFNTENEDFICLLDLREKIPEAKALENIQNADKLFENLSQEKNIKNKLISLVTSIKSKTSSNNKKPATFKYSLHPKLVKLLKDVNYKHIGKDIEFKTKYVSKFKLYNYFLIKNIATLDDLLEWENLKEYKNYNDVLDINKLLINVYTNTTDYSKYFNNDIALHHRQQLINDLILFNISYLKCLNMKHINYVQEIDNNSIELEQDKIKVFQIIDKICNGKFNLLVFAKNYQQLDKKIKEENKKLYNDLINNVYFFKNNKKSEHEIIIKLEIYKHININNYINFYKIAHVLNLPFQINLLFGLKLSVNVNNISCVINQAKQGSTEIMNILSSLHITDDEFKILSYELFNLPSINFILESHMNLNILEKNYAQTLQDFITAKLILIDEFVNKVPVLSNWPILFNKLKILKIKHYILHNADNDDVINTYNNIKDLNDYSEIEAIYRKNEKMKKQILNIYTN
jgi:hypothetical protein